MAALLRGDRVAQQIELSIEYALEPPFAAGSPKTASPEMVARAREYGRPLAEARLETVKRIAGKA